MYFVLTVIYTSAPISTDNFVDFYHWLKVLTKSEKVVNYVHFLFYELHFVGTVYTVLPVIPRKKKNCSTKDTEILRRPVVIVHTLISACRHCSHFNIALLSLFTL